MEQHSNNSPHSPPSQLDQWPNKPAERGKFYGVNDPVFQKEMLCVMTMETWTDVGTNIEQSKRVMALQAKKIAELMATNQALAAQVNDATERLNNLRTARRAEKRQELEGELILPGQREFFTNPPRKS
jgi:hypothetical protein